MRRQEGEVCSRRIVLKVLPAGEASIKKQKVVVQAPAHRLFTEKSIDGTVESFAADLEKAYPNSEFRLVQIGPAEFNFIWAGEKNVGSGTGNS